MREAMTGQLRLALETAQAQARQLNQDFVGTEHLLLGLIAANHTSEESEAVRAIRASEINLDELRESLIKALPQGTETPVVTGQLPFSPTAKDAMNAAIVTATAT